ncbi:MAG: hypothetical protein M3451_14065 [Chloroflexota bacterium]|jgi:hypothetical protein|nr:hypothetical protein [Chloroflexota bacterium]
MGLFSFGQGDRLKKSMAVEAPVFFDGFQFTLKGSPRHYDDVKRIIEANGGAKVWFGEALAYERGAGIALWRVRARNFNWLGPLYDWWVEMERTEPVEFTFHLYLPDNLKYPAMNIRDHTNDEVEAFIRESAPYVRE